MIDGDPGPFFEKAAIQLDIDWASCWPPRGKVLESAQIIPGWKIIAAQRIIKIARKIGYRGSSIKGIIGYLRDLPEDGPIGKN